MGLEYSIMGQCSHTGKAHHKIDTCSGNNNIWAWFEQENDVLFLYYMRKEYLAAQKITCINVLKNLILFLLVEKSLTLGNFFTLK